MDDRLIAREGVRALLRLMGQDPDAPGLLDTPDRVVRAYLELGTSDADPVSILGRTFEVETPDEVIAVGPIPFTSLCEHHLLPFTGTAWVAYKPSGTRVVGLSKIPRLVAHYAARPQVQERLTHQVTAALDEHLDSAGSACLVRSAHACMVLRGVRAAGAAMVTSSLTGIFREDARARAEFLALATP